MRPQFLDFRSDMIKPSFLLFLSLSLSTILFLAHVLFNHSISLKRLFTNNLIHVNIIFNSRYSIEWKEFCFLPFCLGVVDWGIFTNTWVVLISESKSSFLLVLLLLFIQSLKRCWLMIAPSHYASTRILISCPFDI